MQVRERPGSPVAEGCRVTVQMNCNLFMATMPNAIMNFVFKVL